MENNRLNLSQIELGKPIPDWSIESIYGHCDVPAVSDYNGKPLLLLFFSLGCPGGLGRAIPYVNRLVHENGENLNVQGIHTNFEGV